MSDVIGQRASKEAVRSHGCNAVTKLSMAKPPYGASKVAQARETPKIDRRQVCLVYEVWCVRITWRGKSSR